MDEFGLIEQFFTRRARHPEVVLGIGDDAALVALAGASEQLAATTDTLVEGVHFPQSAKAFDVGYKALAVNVSDLAAMGARPLAFLLSLTLPAADPQWLAGFRDGLFALAQAVGIDLIGGDTVRGPLSVTITALGAVAPGAALRRDGARVGDRVYVSGLLGEAALGFLLRGGRVSLPHEFHEPVLTRLDRPVPRIAEGRALVGIASAAIDISDGLVADLGHILAASGVGARLDLRRLPLSAAYDAAFASVGYDPALVFGDDYELCVTVPPEREKALAAAASRLPCGLHYLGDIVAAPGLTLYDGQGVYTPARAGYNHFDDPGPV
ncbi:thiamine-phosphate kinase [Acidiferrobacter sp.]|uniref:thiamine-phosphate kinase n=1 Tax=Acidiferrobacter sp. TaxID=1872107 RepID=UPI002610D761|nr:thiamine-phosphate kinase [Acidiferrobacter sp.]